MKALIGRITKSWEEATHDLGIKILFDQEVEFLGKRYKSFAYLPDFGSKYGVFIGLRSLEDPKVQTKIWSMQKKRERIFR